MSVSDNLKALYKELPPEKGIRLVAVSKYATLPQMIEAYECGVREFGENKIQDLESKIKELPQELFKNVKWHFLGHLQKNKIKKTLDIGIDLIHSVDSLALAEKLSELNIENGTLQHILLQVNLTEEPHKNGFFEETLLSEFPLLLNLKGLAIEGLMTMGPNSPHPTLSPNGGEGRVRGVKQCFLHLKNLRDQLVERHGYPLPELSMGMSQDFVYAIECGATIIRIGNRIFCP